MVPEVIWGRFFTILGSISGCLGAPFRHFPALFFRRFFNAPPRGRFHGVRLHSGCFFCDFGLPGNSENVAPLARKHSFGGSEGSVSIPFW